MNRVFEFKPLETIAFVAMGASGYSWVTENHSQLFQGQKNSEIWTINMGAGVFRHDVVWDMHTEEYLIEYEKKEKARGKDIDRIWRRREWLKKHDKPIVMPYAHADWPTSLTFPLADTIETSHSCYFSTGLAYMFAAAYCIHKKFGSLKTLKIHGCDFSYDRDTNTHDEQGRGCCEYWAGRIIETGVRVEVAHNTHFLDMFTRTQGKIYGYHQPPEFEFPITGGHGRFIGPDYVNNPRV